VINAFLLKITNNLSNIKKSFFSMSDSLITMLIYILVTPILIKKIGVNEYGLILFTNAISALGGFLNFGSSDSVIKHVSQYNHTIDQRKKKVLNTGVSMMLWLNIAISILACLVLYILPLNTVIKHSVSLPQGIDSSMISYCFFVGFLIFFIKNLILVLTAVLKGYERFGTVAIFNNLTLIIYFITLIVIATLGYEIKIILISGLFVYLMSLVGIFFYIFFYSNYVRLNFYFSNKLFKRLTSFSFYSWLQTIAAIVFSQIDRFLIISNLGISSFSFYSISLQLAQTPHSLTGGALNFIFPRVSFQYQNRNDKSLLKNYYRVLLYSFLFSFLIFILLYIFRYDLTRLWINKDFANDTYKTTGYLLIAYLFMSFSIVPHYFLYGLGQIKFVSLINIFSMISSIITFMILIPIIGLNGAIIGRFMYLPLLIINHFKVIKILKNN